MRAALVLLLLGTLTACNRPTAEAPAPVAAKAAAQTDEMPAVDHDCAFCADPGFVRTCEIAKGVRTTLYWNIADDAVQQVNIYVVDDAGKDSPFAQQPPRGSIETGPWLRPGLTFKLKDANGKLLHSLTIAGKDC